MNPPSTALALALCVSALLAACGDRHPTSSSPASPQEAGCSDPDVQKFAKKLLALHLDRTMSPRSDTEAMLDMVRSRSDSQSDAMLNTIRSHAIDANRVRLSDVTVLKSPPGSAPGAAASAPAASGPSEEPAWLAERGKDKLFVCSATATVALPAELIERLKATALAGPGLLQVVDNTISPRIVYMTSLPKSPNPPTGLQVSMHLENYMVGMMLEAVLRSHAVQAPAASQALHGAAGR